MCEPGENQGGWRDLEVVGSGAGGGCVWGGKVQCVECGNGCRTKFNL